MTPIAYLYLPTPSPENVAEIFESILASGVSISHFGRNDPPKKWNGDTQAMARLVLEQPELNKCVFVRDKTNAIELTVELFYDPRWSHSTISLGASLQQAVTSVAAKLIARLNPYLCIQGTSAAGKDQSWHLLHKRKDCPQGVVNGINFSTPAV
ncbi:MAG: hypothetical protein IPH08_10390 [Rhodocyclaceae bacterium]|nr:hypothetical protein [Rhodocyclaceae bacterium]